MKEFQKQLAENAKRFLKEFNEDADLINVRQLYKTQFDIIESLIIKKTPKLAVEDISLLDPNLEEQITSNRLLLQQINNLIFKGDISAKDID
jgi:hypothetical protein